MKAKHNLLIKHNLLCSLLFGASAVVCTEGLAASPLWTITATTPTKLTIPAGTSTTVNYTITNKSIRKHTLMMQPIVGVTQVTTGTGVCPTAATLATNQSCTLQLIISSRAGALNGGPQLCQQGPDGQPSPLQCYQPIASQSLQTSTVPSVVIGQSIGGGKVACLGSGLHQLLIAANSDIDGGSGALWGGFGTSIGSSARSTTDGASNTVAITTALGAGNYAARLCADYEVDSRGMTPCQPGNTCYNDWFLPASSAVFGAHSTPATSQLDCLYINRGAIGGFATAFYWSSTEFNANNAWLQDFGNGDQGVDFKFNALRVRCVRGFTS